MAWKYPKHKFQSQGPMDIERMNENNLAVSQEAGRLNEQNVASNAVSVAGNLSTDVHRFGYDGYHVDPNLNPANALSFNYTGSLTGWTELPMDISWEPVDSVYKETQNSTVFISMSFQQAGDYSGALTGYPIGPVPQYALRVDGSVIEESITQSVDYVEDLNADQAMPFEKAVTIEAIVSLTAGEHTFELVSRAPPSLRLVSGLGASWAYYILSREFLVWEMRR